MRGGERERYRFLILVEVMKCWCRFYILRVKKIDLPCNETGAADDDDDDIVTYLIVTNNPKRCV